MRLATQPLREFSHNSRAKIRIEFFITRLVPSAASQLANAPEFFSPGTALAPFLPGSTVKERTYDQATFAVWPHLVLGSFLPQVRNFLVRSSSRAIRLFFWRIS